MLDWRMTIPNIYFIILEIRMITLEELESLKEHIEECKIFYELDNRIYYFKSDLEYENFRVYLIKDSNFKGHVVSKEDALKQVELLRNSLT